MGGYPSTSYLIDPRVALHPLGIQPGMHIADLGSGGHGHFIFPAASLVGRDGLVYAVDILKPALSSIEGRARHENVRHVRTVWSDLESGRINIPAGTLDRAMLINTLFQTKNRTAVLREARHLLKPEGRLLVIEWRIERAPIGPSVMHKIPRELLLQCMKEADLAPVHEFVVGPYHLGLILART